MQRMLGAWPQWETRGEGFEWTPRVDFMDENGQFILTAELPGVEPEGVDIEIEGNVLTIRGEKKLEREHEGERVRVAERHYGSFERTFNLPSGADPEKIDADFQKGVLTLRIAKLPAARGRKIQVRTK